MPPNTWNGADSRAIVVRDTRDDLPMREVIEATPYGVLGLPGPIAVGIYAFNSALPVRYVPKETISCMYPGWYAPLLLPNHLLSVVITPIPHTQAIAQEKGRQ